MLCAATFVTFTAYPTSTLASATPSAVGPPKALRVPGPLSPRNASYRMHARLDEVTHRVTGSATLTWRNLERKPADKLVFHLYQNAFKNYASAFIFEAGPQLRGDYMPEHGFGAIDVNVLKVNGKDLLSRATVSDTLLAVPLDTPIGPSATVEIELAWTVQLPRVFARSGYFDSYHAVTQWFPKIGVFDCDDENCRFRAHNYHGNTEFFADYGVYDVELDVPANSVVAATGVLIEEKPAGPRRILRYHAEDVHDFAFFSDPGFIEVRDRITDELGSVDVRLLTRRGHEPYNDRHLAALRAALLEAERRLVPYPYSNITVVIPPWEARGSAGMEYPTLFASVAVPFPAGARVLEDVTAHEFMHQFFYGIIGSDEVEEAWLDEGMTEYFTNAVIDRMFGERCSANDTPYFCLSAVDRDWLFYRSTTRHVPIATRAFLMRGYYGAVTYDHTSVAIYTLARYLGEERLTAALRQYAQRARFRHPRKSDFVAAMSEGAQEDLSWFFRQALDSTRVADYQIASVENHSHELAPGLYDCPPPPAAPPSLDSADPEDPVARRAQIELFRESQQAACKEPGTLGPRSPGRYELPPDQKPELKLFDGEVEVERRGDFFFPVDIVATFADGSSERTTWTLAEQQAAPETRTKLLYFPRKKSALVRADVDPENKLVLDENRINNSRYAEPRQRPILRIFFSFVGALHTLFDLLAV